MVSRTNVRVRRADAADAPELARLARRLDLSLGTFSGRGLANDSAEHLTRRFAELIADGQCVLLTAVDDSGIVGLLAARRYELGTIEATPTLHVSHLLVDPAVRRKGVGRTLLAAAVSVAEDSGFDRVLATAGSGSREANRYLARLGFAPLVLARIASTSTLRRSLGITESAQHLALRRRASLHRRSPVSESALSRISRGA